MLTSNPNLQAAPVCTGVDIVVTCMVQEVRSLRWFINGTQHATYLYNVSHTYPRPAVVDIPLSGGYFQVASASPDASDPDIFNAVSTLTINAAAFRQLKIQSIQCGTNSIRSQRIDPMSIRG